MTRECPFCHRQLRPGERVVLTTDCRLEGLTADGYSVAFDVESRNMIVHRLCWDQLLAGGDVPVPVVPDKFEPVETNECTSVERTDALSFLE
jgi:hypothetical protein